MEPKRSARRKDYWNRKYERADWLPDIHFALFPDGLVPTYQDFQNGIENNTRSLVEDIIDRIPVFQFSRTALVIDYGCGAGDLLCELVRRVPGIKGHGYDIASGAVEIARLRARAGTMEEGHHRPEFATVEGPEDLFRAYAGRGKAVDVMVVRDCYYLLSEVEQESLWRFCTQHMQDTGVVVVADLAVEHSREEDLSTDLIERQSGGRVIRWERRPNGRKALTVDDQAAQGGFEVFHRECFESAVADSYRLASENAEFDASVRAAFSRLARVAGKPGGYLVTYVRSWFSRAQRHLGSDPKALGVRVASGYCPIPHDHHWGVDGRYVLMPGDFLVGKGMWSLVLGRSGSGKSTLLRLMARLVVGKGCAIIGCEEHEVYFLEQKPQVIEDMSVMTNIALFARADGAPSGSVVERVTRLLGLSPNLQARLAGDRLSGGERQRVALGQAVSADLPILLLDEPCAGVDRIRRYEFFRSLKEYCEENEKHITLVCVDHDFLSIEAFFDNIYELAQGRLWRVK